MLEEGSVRSADPEGEGFLRALPWPVDTPGGRYFAEFDDEAPVTREGQLVFFAQFLHAGGRWERFVSNTPLHYVGNRGSEWMYWARQHSRSCADTGAMRISTRCGEI